MATGFDTLADVLARLDGVVHKGGEQYEARCPAHEDRRASLSISRGDDGRVLLWCHAGCATPDIAHKLGLDMRDLMPGSDAGPKTKPPINGKKPDRAFPTAADAVADLERKLGRRAGLWTYHNADGEPVGVVVRFDDTEGKKTIRPVCRNGVGWLQKGMPDPRPLYRLPELSDAELVLTLEGEKAADAARDLGFVATTSPHGSQSAGKADWGPLAGKRVAILPDFDEPGRKYAGEVRTLLERLTPRPVVRIIELGGENPGDDVVDHVARGLTAEMLATKIEEAFRLDDEPGESKAKANELSLFLADARTERANGRRFVRKYGGVAAYCGPWQKWLNYNGSSWEVDQLHTSEAWAKVIAAELWDEVAAINKAEGIDDKLKQAVTSFAKSTSSANGIRNMLSLAKSEAGMTIVPGQLDSQPWLLNVQNGTIDLQSGALRPHRREDYLSKIAPVKFDAKASCPQWESFLDRITDGRKSLASFLQRAVGMSLTGVVRDHCLMFCFGSGANGKSVFLNTLKAMLGSDYGHNAPPELLLVKTTGGTHPTEMASLHGKRFVVTTEIDDGRRFAEATLKALTGGDPVTARRLYEDFWTFLPSHHIWIAANHRPTIRGTDPGIWRRIRLIPFTVSIPPEEQDKELPEKLLGELSGILNWALQGVRDWCDYGLQEPSEVTEATKQYRSDMDVVGEFVAEKCATGPQHSVSAGELYAEFKAWAIITGEFVMSQRKFGMKLTERGFEKYRNDGFWYRGIDLRSHLQF